MRNEKTIGPEIGTTIGELARASGKLLLKEIPFLGKFITVLTEAETETRKRRQKLWAEWLLGSDNDPEAYAELIDKAIRGLEGSAVREAVNESIRAALEAVDDIVVPSIALLTRHYLNTKAPDRRTYRELIQILRTFNEAEFCELRRAVNKLAWIEGDPLTTAIIMDPGGDTIAIAIEEGKAKPDEKEVWVWYTTTKPTSILIVGELAPRIVAALEPLHGDLYSIYKEPQRGRNKPRYSRTLIQLMAAVMPETA